MKHKSNINGFTLAELLIVVAIIAVLVAVSIPIFSEQLEKAKQAVDLSNMRSAKAAAVAEYYFEGNNKGEYKYNFDANTGMVTADVPAGYGKSKELTYDGKTYQPLNKYVMVTIDENSVLVEWSDSDTPITNNGGNTIAGGGGIDIPDIPDVPDPIEDDENTGNTGESEISVPGTDYVKNSDNINWNYSEWPTEGNGYLTYTKGQVFLYNGEYYVAHTDMTGTSYNKDYYPTLESINCAVKVSSHKIKTSADIKTDGYNTVLDDTDIGDIFVAENGDVYIRAFGSGRIYINSGNLDGQWIRISK